jgi:hypothetical protein
LERGFQGENLSVDDRGLLGDWRLRQYLQFKQIGEQDGFVARAAVAAETERAAENVVLCTTSFANLSVAADAAFVHGVAHEGTATTEFSAQLTLVDRRERDATESECALAVGWCAIASTRIRQWAWAQRTGGGCATRR